MSTSDVLVMWVSNVQIEGLRAFAQSRSNVGLGVREMPSTHERNASIGNKDSSQPSKAKYVCDCEVSTGQR